MVPQEGLEPPRLSAIDFESTASTIPPLGRFAVTIFTYFSLNVKPDCATYLRLIPNSDQYPVVEKMGIPIQPQLAAQPLHNL